MMGLGTAFSGKMNPELLQALADTPEQGKQMAEAFNQRELSKLPSMSQLPKELKNLIKEGRITRDQLKEV